MFSLGSNVCRSLPHLPQQMEPCMHISCYKTAFSLDLFCVVVYPLEIALLVLILPTFMESKSVCNCRRSGEGSLALFSAKARRDLICSSSTDMTFKWSSYSLVLNREKRRVLLLRKRKEEERGERSGRREEQCGGEKRVTEVKYIRREGGGV